jgi:hypothetical protein
MEGGGDTTALQFERPAQGSRAASESGRRAQRLRRVRIGMAKDGRMWRRRRCFLCWRRSLPMSIISVLGSLVYWAVGLLNAPPPPWTRNIYAVGAEVFADKRKTKDD